MKILFIGNSHTYMNDMPKLVQEMIENVKDDVCEVVMMAYSARPLKWHVNEEYFSVRFNILYGKYDYCVIQEQAHPMAEEHDTAVYANQIIEWCKKAKTIPIIFEPWAEKNSPEIQNEMNRRYRSLAHKENVLLAPIGEVWSSVYKEIKNQFDVDLYYKDGSHASYVGDYLVAMVLTKVITNKLPSIDSLKAYDFTIPESDFIPVNENPEDEVRFVSSEISEVIRKNIMLVC